jgi:hypothetical protein
VTKPSVRQAVLLLLLAARAGAADPGPGAAEPRTDVRKELLSEYRYVPHPADAAPIPVFLAAAAPSPDAGAPYGPEVVTMAPFTVRETVRMETLHADLLQEKRDAHTAMVMSKLGIGLHVAPVGPVAFYAATLFYIPFAAGFSISW